MTFRWREMSEAPEDGRSLLLHFGDPLEPATGTYSEGWWGQESPTTWRFERFPKRPKAFAYLEDLPRLGGVMGPGRDV